MTVLAIDNTDEQIVAEEDFSERMADILNAGSLALMISIGHRTGLFDAMGNMPPATSAEIAAKARLNERYVREWLGAMTTGGIVEVDPLDGFFSLPAERAAWLTRDAAPNNMAAFTQYVAVLGGVEDRIVDCFHNGGGVPYSAYPRFHEVMAEDSGQTVVAALTDHILPLDPELVGRLTRGIEVLDVGCGSGRALNLLAKTFPASRFTGYDISEEAIGRGRQAAADAGLTNLSFEIKDVSQLHDTQRYDLITAFDAVHDQAHPDLLLAGIHQALRDDGLFLMQDIAGSSHVHHNIDHPIGPFLYTISCMHCMTVSLAQGGAGLGAMWGKETAVAMLTDAGFGRIDVEQLDHDIQNYFYLVRKA